MKGKTHFYTGLVIMLIFIYFSEFNFNSILFSFAFLIGCIFPDIDHNKSIIGRKIKIIGWAFKHRGFFHSIFALILFSFLIYIFNDFVAIFFAMGYLIHLLEDMLTKSGIKLFIIGPKISGGLVVGEFSENIILFLFKLISLFLIILIILRIV